jgi:hypothetical protein
MTIHSTPPLVKTQTAADYVQRHARNGAAGRGLAGT